MRPGMVVALAFVGCLAVGMLGALVYLGHPGWAAVIVAIHAPFLIGWAVFAAVHAGRAEREPEPATSWAAPEAAWEEEAAEPAPPPAPVRFVDNPPPPPPLPPIKLADPAPLAPPGPVILREWDGTSPLPPAAKVKPLAPPVAPPPARLKPPAPQARDWRSEPPPKN